MGRDFADALAALMAGYIIAGVIAVSCITLALVFGIPWVWESVKPLLHEWTK